MDESGHKADNRRYWHDPERGMWGYTEDGPGWFGEALGFDNDEAAAAWWKRVREELSDDEATERRARHFGRSDG